MFLILMSNEGPRLSLFPSALNTIVKRTNRRPLKTKGNHSAEGQQASLGDRLFMTLKETKFRVCEHIVVALKRAVCVIGGLKPPRGVI